METFLPFPENPEARKYQLMKVDEISYSFLHSPVDVTGKSRAYTIRFLPRKMASDIFICLSNYTDIVLTDWSSGSGAENALELGRLDHLFHRVKVKWKTKGRRRVEKTNKRKFRTCKAVCK